MVLRTTFVNADHFSWCSKGPWCLALKQTAGGAATSCKAPEAVLVAWQHPRGSCVPSGTCPRVGMVCSVTGWIFPIVRAPDASTGVHLFALLKGVSTKYCFYILGGNDAFCTWAVSSVAAALCLSLFSLLGTFYSWLLFTA